MDNPAGDLVGACHICGREIRAHFEPGFGSIVVIRAARTAAERHLRAHTAAERARAKLRNALYDNAVSILQHPRGSATTVRLWWRVTAAPAWAMHALRSPAPKGTTGGVLLLNTGRARGHDGPPCRGHQRPACHSRD